MSYASRRTRHPVIDELKAARVAQGLSQTELARQGRVNQNTISMAESGRNPNPTWYTVVDLAGVLGKDVCLMDEEEYW